MLLGGFSLFLFGFVGLGRLLLIFDGFCFSQETEQIRKGTKKKLSKSVVHSILIRIVLALKKKQLFFEIYIFMFFLFIFFISLALKNKHVF